MADVPTESADQRTEVDPSNLTAEQRMLITIRDTLYEGSWGDFVRDLRSRRDGRPHVFDIIPASSALKDTIQAHLALITRLAAWEEQHGIVLRLTPEPGGLPGR